MSDAWQPIETAPATGEFWAFNPVVGVYLTEREGDQFPCTKWGKDRGNWFPRPTQWHPLVKPREPEQEVRT